MLLLCIYTYKVDAQCSTGCTVAYDHTGTTSGSIGSGTVTLSTGDTMCINATSGNITVDYDAVRFRPGSGLKMCSDPEDTIKWNNPISFFSGGTGTHVEFFNYGNFEYTVGNLGFARVHIHNYGHWNINGDFAQNSTGPPSFSNYAGGSVLIEGTFDVNNGPFLNEGILEATGDLDFNGNDFTNTGSVTVGGELTINSSSNVYINGGVFIATDLLINGGNFDASGSAGCSAFLITNNTHINSGVSVTGGNVWITDSTNADTINTNNCGSCGFTFDQTNDCFTSLPVELIQFNGRLVEGGVQLNWSTLSEKNNSHFIIERSTNLEDFTAIDLVYGSGTTSEITHYQFLDNSPNLNGRVYYRLRQVDFDGTAEYTPIVSVNLKEIYRLEATAISDYLLINSIEDEDLIIRLNDISGKILINGVFQSNEPIRISHLDSGYYVLTVMHGTDQQSFKLLKF